MDRIADFMRSIVGKRGASRLQSNLNRPEIAFGRFAFRADSRQLLRDGEPVVLNGKAFELLALFLESDGRIVTRDELYQRLWGDRIVEEANLSQTVYLLRRALDPDGDGRTFIETVPRIGYRFVPSPCSRTAAPPLAPRGRRFVLAAAGLCLMIFAAVPWFVSGQHAEIPTAARNADELGRYHLALRTPQHLAYALSYFKEAQRAAPGDVAAYAGAASAYALLAEFETEGSARQSALVASALRSTTEALRRNAGFSQALAVRGFIAYRFHDDDAAATRDLARAIDANPADGEAHLWRGVLFMREGDVASALSDFQAAHRTEPTSEVYTRWLARAYAFEGKPEQAIAEAHETLRIEPDDAPAMFMLSQAQEQRGDLRGAIATLRALLRKDPYERPYVIPDLARLELRLGTADSSYAERRVAMLASAGRVDPFETALLYLTMGDRAAGMKMLRRTKHSLLAIQRYDPRLLALL